MEVLGPPATNMALKSTALKVGVVRIVAVACRLSGNEFTEIRSQDASTKASWWRAKRASSYAEREEYMLHTVAVTKVATLRQHVPLA